MAINEDKLHEFLGKAVVDMGATFHAASVLIGDRLGLYKALAKDGPLTAADLASKTGTHERYVREWANGQAAGGYVEYENGKYSMTPEQAMCMADDSSPAFLPGGFQVAAASLLAGPKIEERFKSGDGMGWHEHDANLFEGTERFFRPNYGANLVTNWIPALNGVEAKLKAGAHVADVGCGLGASTILMAKAYPKSTFAGFDYHEPSIKAARERAEKAGVADRITFEVSRADAYPGSYDFVAFFDCLHDMGDPGKVAGHVKKSLKPDGAWMLVEPFAHDEVEKNLNPVGRVFYCVSTLVCTPASLAQEGRAALGAQAGEKQLGEVAKAGGFTSFRRATETPFNLVFEAKA